jgi:hypothetical protein
MGRIARRNWQPVTKGKRAQQRRQNHRNDNRHGAAMNKIAREDCQLDRSVYTDANEDEKEERERTHKPLRTRVESKEK